MADNFLIEALADARQRVKIQYAPSYALKGAASDLFHSMGLSNAPWMSESRAYMQLRSSEEQAIHLRGRVYSAINVTVSRVSRQPILCARQLSNKSSKARAEKAGTLLKQYVDRGDIDFDLLPRWVCKAASNAEDLEIIEHHPVLDVLHKPNPLMVRSNLWQSTIPALDITGAAYWIMDRNPDVLIPVPPTWMVGVIDPDSMDFSHFMLKPPRYSGAPIRVPKENVARFYNADPFDLFGIFSPLQAIARTVLADEAIESAQEANFRNSMRPAMAVMTGDETAKAVKLQPEQRGQIVSWIRRELAGAERNGAPVILDSMIRDVKPLFNAPNEMDYGDSSKITKANIYENWATSPIVAGMVEGANRAGSAVAEFNYAANRANPIASLISETLTETVAPFYNNDRGKLFLWIEEIKPHDPDHQRNLIRDLRDGGGLMIDEHRRFVGLPPLPDDQGKAFMRRVQQVFVPVDGGEPTVYSAINDQTMPNDNLDAGEDGNDTSSMPENDGPSGESS